MAEKAQEKEGGDLPRGWKEVSIGEIADVVGGGTPSSKIEKYWHGTIPWLTPKDLSGYAYRRIGGGKRNISPLGLKKSSAQLLPKDTVLVTSRAPIGYVALADGEVTTNQGFKNLILNTGYDPEFFYYLIKHNVPKMKALQTGSTFGEISGNSMKQIRLKVPPLSEQRRIAGILGSLDDKIELNRRMSETLEAISQAIFKSWFIDFDPVIDNALAAGNKIPEALQARAKARQAMGDKRRPLPPSIQSLFPVEFESAPQGPIPKGWKITTMKDTVNIIKGKSYKSSELSKSDTALVTLKSFSRGGGYRIDGLKEYTGSYKPEQEVFTGDLVIACTDITQSADVVGKPAIVVNDRQYKHLVISLDAILIRPNVPKYVSFFYNLARTERFQNHTLSYSTGTTVLHLNKDAIPKFEFVMPETKIMNAYAKYAKDIFNLMASSVVNTNCLATLREFLLPKLLSGGRLIQMEELE